LAILGAAVLWSTAGAFIKLTQLDAWQVAGGRSAVAALTLLLLLPGSRRRLDRATALVAVAYAATVALFVFATKLTTAANAIFIQDTAPLYVVLLSPALLGERPSRLELLSVPLYAAGLFLFFKGKLDQGQLLGNGIALLAGVAFALCIIGLRKLPEKNGPALVWGNVLAALITAPFLTSGPSPGAVDVLCILFLGVFQLGVAYALFGFGLRSVTAVEASLLVLLEPVLNPLWTYLAVGEQPGQWALWGGAVILGTTAARTLVAFVQERQLRQKHASPRAAGAASPGAGT
jgi:drug/metabolite transporter (DMT)-like permease